MKDRANSSESGNPQLPAQKNGAKKKKVQIRRLDKIETTALNGSGG